MTEKTCFKCHLVKPLSEFYKHPQMSDGHLGKCKSCTKSEVTNNRRSKREYYSQYDRLRFRTDRRKKSVVSAQRKRRIVSPEKYKARNAVSNALRDGRLKKECCQNCGNPKSQAHHDDYSKPLDVKWLCFKCHRETKHNQVVTAIYA